MNWQTALCQRLLDDAAVAALIGSSAEWDVRTGMPGVVLELITDPRPQTMKGFQQLRRSRVQVTCYAAKKLTAVAIREAAIAALVPAGVFGGERFERGFVDGGRGTKENTETGTVHRESIDLLIWHE